ncbi:MAG: hypothetical protein ACPHID_05915 [Thermoplasmatota archaeon]
MRRHAGGLATVDETRRPMYQHMISNELVGGASMVRFDGAYDDGADVDVLIGATCGFDGDDVVTVDELPEGDYAVQDYEGPEAGVEAARLAFLDAVRAAGHEPLGRLVQVHLMDAIEGETEQQFQVRIA